MVAQDPPPEAADLLTFLDAAPSPYHAVQVVAERLERAGYRACDERERWELGPGTRAYAVRGGGSLIAFEVGSEPPERAGFVLIGAHTDSPNLRLKPKPDLTSGGYRQLAVEVYGGVLLSTWLDRDLSLAGRLVFKGGQSELVNLRRSVCRIPNLAIHLNREVNTTGLLLNAQTHMLPVLGLEASPDGGLAGLLAECLEQTPARGAQASDVLAFELCLYDTQGAALSGERGELIASARLDNLVSCHAACQALLAAQGERGATRVIALYDHEEVGSQSAAGARSSFLSSVLERICAARGSGGNSALAQAIARSLLVSADMAHALHPNYTDKHDKQHRPLLGAGPVLKTNVNQSYATDAVGAAAFIEACRAVEVTPQHFASRNDTPCGSTIGPITAARLGLRTVDVGGPMLAMHSCREMSAASDASAMIRVLAHLLSHFSGLSAAH